MKNVYIEIQCEFGTFKTNVIQISDEDYPEFILKVNEYHKGTFSSITNDGNYIVIPPEVLKKSILIVREFE